MEDTSFIDLTKEENLSKINIDPRLIEPFKEVMKKMQAYFNASGYTEKINYTEYFKKYLIGKDFKIQVNDLPSKIGAAGFYEKDKNRICIDEKELNEESLQGSLCHEFIHFLVMHGRETGVPTFINEGLTESLTRKMYPEDNAYEPHVRMMEFENILKHVEINYVSFLEGKFPYLPGDIDDLMNEYHEKNAGNYYNFKNAQNDDNYINVQREILENFLGYIKNIIDFGEYVEILNCLRRKPVADEEWINKYLESIEKCVTRNIKNSKIKQSMLKKLKEYRKIKQELGKYPAPDKYIFEFNGEKFVVTINKVNEKTYRSEVYNEFTRKLRYSFGLAFCLEDDDKEITINTLDIFLKRQKLEIQERQLRELLGSMSREDEIALTSISDKDKLVKLEKIQLPQINSKNPLVVYLAIYQDRVELIGSATKIRTVKNLQISRYIGFNENCIVGEPLHKTDDAIVCVPVDEKEVKEAAVRHYRGEDKKNQGITLSDFEKLSNEIQQKYLEKVLEGLQQFVIYRKDGNFEVGLMYDKKTAFIGKKCTLIDPKGNGLFNDYFDAINNERAANQVVDLQQTQSLSPQPQRTKPLDANEICEQIEQQIEDIYCKKATMDKKSYFKLVEELLHKKAELLEKVRKTQRDGYMKPHNDKIDCQRLYDMYEDLFKDIQNSEFGSEYGRLLLSLSRELAQIESIAKSRDIIIRQVYEQEQAEQERVERERNEFERVEGHGRRRY